MKIARFIVAVVAAILTPLGLAVRQPVRGPDRSGIP